MSSSQCLAKRDQLIVENKELTEENDEENVERVPKSKDELVLGELAGCVAAKLPIGNGVTKIGNGVTKMLEMEHSKGPAALPRAFS